MEAEYTMAAGGTLSATKTMNYPTHTKQKPRIRNFILSHNCHRHWPAEIKMLLDV